MISGTNSKILIISLDYLPTIGGSYRVLHELMIRSHQSNVIVMTCIDKDATDYDKALSYRIVRSAFISFLNEDSWLTKNLLMKDILDAMYFRLLKKAFKYLFFPILTFIYLLCFIKTRNINKIIFAQSVFPFAWYTILLNKFTNLGIITFVYGEDIVGYRKKGKISKYLRMIYLKGLHNADIVVANSNVTKNECLSDAINSEKIVVLYPALDYDLFFPRNKNKMKELYNLSNRYVIMTVGMLVRHKGFDTVLKIMPGLIKKIPEIIYIIRGEGPDKQYLDSIIKENKIEKYVQYIGDLPYEKLPTLYSAADLFVMPNRIDEIDNEQEGFGIVFLEANACGLPVIGGDSGGVKDIISNGDNGFLIDPNNHEEITNKILELYYTQNKFIESSIRDYIMRKYNWDDAARIFQSLIN